MDRFEILDHVEKMLQRDAYQSKILDELYNLGYNVVMMGFYRDVAHGKAFAAIELYNQISGDYDKSDRIYQSAIEDATAAIHRANNNIIQLLDLAGFDGAAHYSSTMKYLITT